jgi:hypothetical protein
MKVSGFTIVRNASKYNYPVLESIRSILPICDEFIVNVGDSEDNTLDLIRSLNDPKIRIIQTRWDMNEGATVLSRQTNIALAECKGSWAFYLQSDEVIHEKDLPRIRRAMERYVDSDVDALRFYWFHFYGSYYRYRIDRGWYQKQDRIIRNNGKVESFGDAYAFQRKDGSDIRRKSTGAYLYHYGWVQPEDLMAQRRKNAEDIGFVRLQDNERGREYSFGDLNRFPVYYGTHPQRMHKRIAEHSLSQNDFQEIRKKYWWYPPFVLKIRYKTGLRVKEKIS